MNLKKHPVHPQILDILIQLIYLQRIEKNCFHSINIPSEWGPEEGEAIPSDFVVLHTRNIVQYLLQMDGALCPSATQRIV